MVKALFNALLNTLEEVKSKKLRETLNDVKVAALVGALADTQAEGRKRHQNTHWSM